MRALQPQPWLAHPLGEALLRFNLQPSRWLHPSRVEDWLPPRLQELLPAVQLHRAASAALLRRAGLRPVRGLEHPVLPICMAGAGLFEDLTLYCGLVWLAPAIRRAIVRAEVAALHAELGARALAYALGARCWLLPAGIEPPALEATVRAQALRLGSSVLRQAMASAPAEIARRGALRLSADAEREGATSILPTTEQAVDLARSVLNELDPAWLSSFPVPR